MDFWKTLVVLVRRWYVAVPTLVMSLGLAAVTFQSVPPKFEANGSVVLLSPSGGASTKSLTGQTNPLLGFDTSLSTVSTALTQVLLSPDVVNELTEQGATADYQVGNGNLGGPFINVIADGRSPSEAQRTVRLVLTRARTELENREAAYHAPPSTYIQVDDLVKPTEAKQLLGGKVRAAGAALALGLAASLSMAFLVESVGENRRERRRRERRAGLRTEMREMRPEVRPEMRAEAGKGPRRNAYDNDYDYDGFPGEVLGPSGSDELTTILARRAHGRAPG